MIRRLAWRWLEARHNPGWRAQLAAVHERSALTPDAFRAWQANAVEAHLAWARAHVPFWRERLRAGAGLAEAPVLTRADLQTRLDLLVDERRDRADLRPDASGGSTGQPVRVVHDRDYWTATFATEAWLHQRWGLSPWPRAAYLWGDDRTAGSVTAKERLRNRLLGRVQLNAFAMDEPRMTAFAATLARFRPEVVQGYVSALDLFACHLLAHPEVPLRPRIVRSAAETLLPAQRERIERAFGVPVRDVYGSREAASLAAQCLAGGFHVLEHGKVVEIVDDAGRPSAPGAPGRVLVTDLSNRAMGLIRYENGDVAAWLPDRAPCACGLPYARLERVLGRTSDFVTTPRGERIHGEWFTHLFYGRDDVVRFQVRQRALDRVEVLTEGPADAVALAPLLERMRARLGPGVEVRWSATVSIAPGPSGKHRFTISDVPWQGGRP